MNHKDQDNDCLDDYVRTWAMQYPEKHKQDIMGRLREQAQFNDAFIELFLFTLFTHLGYSVDVHPDVRGDTRHPDFLVTKGHHSFFLEAKVDYNMSSKERNHKNQIEKLKRALNKKGNPGLGLIIRDFSIIDQNKPEPSIRGLTRDIRIRAETWKRESGSINDPFEKSEEEFEYSCPNLSCRYSFFSLSDALAKSSEAAIIDASFKATTLNYHETLLESVLLKANGYAIDNKPYLICIYEMNAAVDEFGVAQALLGEEKIQLGFNQAGELISESYYRLPTGFFTSERRLGVSGVLVFGPHLHLTDEPKYWFFINEEAEFPLRYEDLPFSYYIVSTQGCSSASERKSISDIVKRLKASNLVDHPCEPSD